MEKQLSLLEKNEEEFNSFILEFKELLKNVVDNPEYIKSDDFSDSLSSLVIYANAFGIQYGLNHRFRRCNSEYIKQTANHVNIISLEVSFRKLVEGFLYLYKHIVECKKIFICMDFEKGINIPNVLISKRWIPGTLTNTKYTWAKYQFEGQNTLNKQKSLGSRHGLPVSLVFSFNPGVYPVISRETLSVLTKEIIYDTSRSKIKQANITYVGIVDTNIKTIDHTNILSVCLNCYSRYTRILINKMLNYLFEIAKK